MASSEITLEAVPSAGDVPAADWDACANPTSDLVAALCDGAGQAYNPFVSHAFFSAAEKSGSATIRTGWATIMVAEVASHARNRYILSFHPTDLTPGLHTIEVKLTQDYGAHVVARNSYWAIRRDAAGQPQ